jgi:tRNA nucleotidyltransferase (CCA-adding enzyme)
LGGQLAGEFLGRIHAPEAIRGRVIPLVVNHLFHVQELSDRAIRRLALRLEPENIESLSLVMSADSMGRPPRPATVPGAVTELLSRARELNVRQSAPRPVLLGRHLIELGMPPGPAFGILLHRAYEAQLEGAFFSLPEALEWLERNRNDS